MSLDITERVDCCSECASLRLEIAEKRQKLEELNAEIISLSVKLRYGCAKVDS